MKPIIAIIIVIVCLLGSFFLLTEISKRRNRRTSTEIAEILERFVNGTSETWEWDDFISVKLKDSELDRIRKECGQLPDKYPPQINGHYCGPEGIKIIQQYIFKLRYPRKTDPINGDESNADKR